MTNPVLVTLDKGGYDKDIKRRKYKGKTYFTGNMALHCPIAHMMGEPCVRFIARVDCRNVLKILEHESVHHVIQEILGPYDDTLDNLLDKLPDYNPVRKRLLFGR